MARLARSDFFRHSESIRFIVPSRKGAGMDPNQAWSDLAEAVEESDWGAATEIAENLAEWLAKGGVPPRITGRTEFDRIVIRATVQSIATWEVV